MKQGELGEETHAVFNAVPGCITQEEEERLRAVEMAKTLWECRHLGEANAKGGRFHEVDALSNFSSKGICQVWRQFDLGPQLAKIKLAI